MKKVNLFLLCFLLLICTACKMGLDSIKRNTELEFITIDLDETKTLYAVDSDFDPSRTVILGHYSDGSIKKENSYSAYYDGFNSSEKKKIQIKVLFENKQAAFDIEIGDRSEDYIDITNYPKKLLYQSNQVTIEDIKKNLDGLEVKLFYTDNSEPTILSFAKGEYKLRLKKASGSPSDDIPYIKVEVIVSRNELDPVSFYVYLIHKETKSKTWKITRNQDIKSFYNSQEIDFTGMKIDITITYTIKHGGWFFGLWDTEEDASISINNGCCFINKRIIDTDDSANTYNVIAQINDLTIPISLKVDNYVFYDVEIVEKDPDFYAGEEFNFFDKLQFYVVTRNNNRKEITKEDGGENLKFFVIKENTTESEVTSENAQLANSELASFGSFGNHMVCFFYKYHDIKTDEDEWHPFYYKALVHDAKFNRIEVKNIDKIIVPLSVDNKTIKDYFKGNIWGYYSNDTTGFEVNIENCTFTIIDKLNEDDFAEGEVTKKGKVHILYRINDDFKADTTIEINFTKNKN